MKDLTNVKFAPKNMLTEEQLMVKDNLILTLIF